jgi:hypothetical protein
LARTIVEGSRKLLGVYPANILTDLSGMVCSSPANMKFCNSNTEAAEHSDSRENPGWRRMALIPATLLGRLCRIFAG